MGFFKRLFGVSTENNEKSEEDKKIQEAKNFDILKYDGVKAMRMQRTDYAVECFLHALNLKDDLEIRDYLSQCYISQGELALAYRHLEKIAEAQSDNIAVLLRMANVAFMMEDYVVMGQVCEKALLIDKDSSDALYLYAKACRGTDDSANAIAMLTKAISVRPDFAEAYLLRGEVFFDGGNLDEADEDALLLLEKYPDNEDILMLKANIEKAKGNAIAAIDFFGKVIDANPFNCAAFANRAELREKTGDAKGAKEDAERAAELADNGNDEKQENIESKTKELYNNINPLGI